MRQGAVVGLIVACALISGCGEGETTVLVRGADDVAVLTPDEVSAMRATVTTTLVPLVSTDAAGETPAAGEAGSDSSVADTVPQNVDDRPAEIRLFEAFGLFRGCIEDEGYEIEGDLADPNNPAYQDSAYLEVVRTCAARSDIVNVLNEVQATRSALTPEEVEQRNEAFKALEDCLVPKGWTIETRTNEIGLIEPATFVGPDGTLDERDVNQCMSDTGILDAVEQGSGG